MGALLPLAQLTESGLPRAKKRCLAAVSIPFLQAPASLLLHNCRLCGVVLKCDLRQGCAETDRTPESVNVQCIA